METGTKMGMEMETTMGMEAMIPEVEIEGHCTLLAIEIANYLMDQKVRVYAARQAKNKIRMDNNPRDNHAQQPLYKRSPTVGADQRTLTCFECGNQGHYRSECPRLKNQNCGNQTRNGKARGRVYALG
ncbi:reverse transcriptase domain-containing protein [Tanacetum coccineum]|uniref:Reverse transcriptase domain-containing protein n=1 Tax=Tanacetum coccineum TaxID=301880 RepID=A0ABQ4WAT7_9ASTR